VIRKIADDEQVGVAEGVIEGLDGAAHRFEELVYDGASLGSAVFEQAL
jgi:hypothetical protein